MDSTAGRLDEERFRLIFDRSADPAFLIDGDAYADCNDSALRFLGYSRERLVGLRQSHTAPERQPDGRLSSERIKELNGIALEKGAQRFEWVCRSSDGRDAWVEVSLIAIPLNDRRILYMVWRDIGARKEAEALLREAQERFRIVVEQSGDGIAFLSGELYANTRFMDILGWDGFEGNAVEKVRLADMTRILEKGAPRYETTRPGKDGAPVHVEVSRSEATLLTGPAVVVHVRDITERKRMEKERAMLESRLRQSIETLGTLAERLPHALNNILTPIVGYGSVLKEKMGSDNPFSPYVDRIVACSEKATELVRDLAGSGRQELSFEPEHLNGIVRDAVKELLSGGVELSIKLADEDPVIRADASQLKGCIARLAAYILEGAPGERRLRIETGTASDVAKAGGPGQDRYGVLSISWAGDRAGEAEPPPASKEADLGAALRLSTAYDTVRRHEGCVAFSGDGLRMYIPLIVENKEAESAPATEDDADTLLVADDDSTVRGLMAEALRIYGYNVLEAADGEDAISTFVSNRDRVRLLLLDMDMPGKNGREVYEYLAEAYPGVKAIFVTGGPIEVVSVQDGRVSFVQKPVSASDLVSKIREALEDRG